eukprot:TRINITY_DN958_c0_g5_i2.p1 TRINITY_DN958_c0_g5~~TRINITY_DN958_c0_g5_i2.p1  ORF type:complete len:122 (-),score=30.06 TRINITY_DN958_c0_g5_i2:133-498(-)
MRENTLASRVMEDNVPKKVKKERLNRMADVINRIQFERYRAEIGKMHLILTETKSKKSDIELKGFCDNGMRCIIPNTVKGKEIQIGEYVAVKIDKVIEKTLRGTPIAITSIGEFYKKPVTN